MAIHTDTFIRDSLRHFGLSSKEASIYEACLAKGELSVIELARIAGLSRSTAYFVADELIKKGLLKFIQKGAHRIYSAEDPRKLELLLERQRERVTRNKELLTSLLPELNMRYSGAANKPIISYYTGQAEMRQIFEDALISGTEELLFVGSLQVLIESVGADYLNTWNRKKIKAGIKTRGVWEYGTTTTHPFLQATPENMRHARFAPENFHYPTYTLLYGNKVANLSSVIESYGVLIESKDLSTSTRSWFNLLWNSSK